MESFQPNWVARVLTPFVSFTYYAVIVVGAVLLIGMPIIKATSSDLTGWSFGVQVPVALKDAEFAVRTAWGDASIELERSNAKLMLPLSDVPWSVFSIMLTFMAFVIAMALTFLHHLRSILLSVRRGTPFHPTNAQHLRWLGIITLSYVVLKSLYEFAIGAALANGIRSDALVVFVGIDIVSTPLIYGLVLLALAEVFRHGSALEEERALTV